MNYQSDSLFYFCPWSVSSPGSNLSRIRLRSILVLLIALCLADPAVSAQIANRIIAKIDSAQVRVLPNHHPQWAIAKNSVGQASSDLALTMVLSRTPEQEAALEKLLADQQDPSSPDYHHWLVPAEFGERFGLSESDIAAVTGWLQSQGLEVSWVAPSRTFIRFGGKAADVGRTFQTEINRYNVDGKERFSVSSDPLLPAALTPAVKSIRGLYTVDEQPQHQASAISTDSPQITTSNGTHFIGPGDFAAIYDLPVNFNGAGQTIGIVGRSRTNPADFNNFKNLIGSNFTNPTEIVPTALGGADPGPALAAPPTGGVSAAGDQGEATLDVLRAGSTAPGAQLLLVVATSASGGIGVDTQYLVQTTPVPAQIITISFGACESAAGSAGVAFWDSLFQQAAAEGISTFVSSGDSGASGCDPNFTAPPTTPRPNSPNYICSSGYATCVGGTEFNDTASPSTYWNVAYLGQTAHGYIPEGGWNESWNGTTSTVAASGGGVSTVVATPPWQTGAGVPVNRSGRYTPDVSFSASMHDGYFACFAAGGGSCVVSNGSFSFMYFSGTSAAAPSMAAMAALLNQNLGAGQGNLNPGLYQMAVSAPTAFHDVTLATSGVTSCDLSTPSLCNNSIPGPSGLSGGQTGYAVGAGYDEVTGLGSLDAATFVYAYSATSKVMTPTLTLNGLQTVNTYEPFFMVAYINGSGYSPAPTGTITFTVGSYTSSPIAVPYGQALVTVPVGTIPVGTYAETAVYTPDAASAQIYRSVSASMPFTMIVPPKVPPQLALTTSQTIISNSQSLSVGVIVNAGQYYSTPAGLMVPYYPTPTGSVALTSGSYTSAPVALAGGNATVIVPAGSLAAGNDVLTVTYTPDAAGSSNFLIASNQTYVQNEGARITPSVTPWPSPSTPTTAQAVAVQVTVDGFTGNPTPTGTVVLTGGSYTSVATALAAGAASITIPAGALPPGFDTLTATYTPDAKSAALYASASGWSTIGVAAAVKITPALTVTSLTANPTTVQPLSLAIELNGGTGNPVPSGYVTLQNGGYNSISTNLAAGRATATIPVGSLSGGTDTITATYWPDTNGAYGFNSASTTIAVIVAKAAPTVTITPSLTSMTTIQSFQISASVSGGAGSPLAGGMVTLTCGFFTSDPLVVFPPGNTISITIPAGSLPPGTDTLSASYTGNTTYTSASGTTTVTVTMPNNASFGVDGTKLSLTKGATGGNSSTVTVTPTNGFVGAVALAAAITGSPAGAQNLPTLSFGSTSPVTVAGLNPGTAKLTITTVYSASGALIYPPRPEARWYATGGAALACILLFCIPVRRRSWQTIIGSLMLLVALTGCVLACGGGGSGSDGGGGTGNSGTTSGVYTITITGTAGSTIASNTITLTVQ
jgi:pseudomonalisin